jgi:GH24 family phage-related lysozyme (muramidase)
MPWSQVEADLKYWENDVPHFYLDTCHNITAGVGHLVATVAAAQQLGFVLRGSGAKAGAAAIAYDFIAVSRQAEGQPAKYYLQFTALELPPSERIAILRRDINAAARDLLRLLPALAGYPVDVRRALIDMRFNLGYQTFTTYTRLATACEKGDWKTAANESARFGISPLRNEWTRELFLTP